jgi:hypothetical protein
VHGATDTTVKENINNKTEHVADLVDVPDFHASLLHAMGIDGNLELQTPIGRPLNLSFGKPVPQFFAS